MTHNGYTYGRQVTPMRAEDLEVGQKLVEVSSYGYGTNYNFHEWTVAKVLKTRVVLTREGYQGRTIELRMIVNNDKYGGSRVGEVTTKAEGEASSYRDSHSLYTLDDPELDRMRSMNEFLAVKRQAVEAAEKITKGSISKESAQKAIDALQAFITATAEG